MAYYNRTTAIKDSESHWRGTAFIIGDSKKYGKYIKVEKPLSEDVVECWYYDAKEFAGVVNRFIRTHGKDPDLLDDDEMYEFVASYYSDILEEIVEKVDLIYKRNNQSNEARNRKLMEERYSNSSNSSHNYSVVNERCHWGSHDVNDSTHCH